MKMNDEKLLVDINMKIPLDLYKALLILSGANDTEIPAVIEKILRENSKVKLVLKKVESIEFNQKLALGIYTPVELVGKLIERYKTKIAEDIKNLFEQYKDVWIKIFYGNKITVTLHILTDIVLLKMGKYTVKTNDDYKGIRPPLAYKKVVITSETFTQNIFTVIIKTPDNPEYPIYIKINGNLKSPDEFNEFDARLYQLVKETNDDEIIKAYEFRRNQKEVVSNGQQ